MATHIPGLLEEKLRAGITSSKVLVVGAGGIGCELLKDLVLAGFEDIEVIDLDTIDVSNLNRQFLFQKKHVGKSKAEVAKESALRFNPRASITAHHDSIIKSTYGMSFYQKFDLVMNALDNRSARNHVNRMCLAADIPLVESGTAGYLGQVTVIKKGVTECYECQPKPSQKTYPGCTIRNTPSEPIHCIVWAKHLFNQLFGEADPDEDVSPDAADPEQVGQAGQAALGDDKDHNTHTDGNVTRVSTRAWAKSHQYQAKKLFTKLFTEDIHYLLTMDKLWEKRRKPTPLLWDSLPSDGDDNDNNDGLIEDQRPWSVERCRQVFETAVNNLYNRVKSEEKEKEDTEDDVSLTWDKDDPDSMDFVTSCANIRAHIFNIPQKTRFDVKSMAGAIIPAIATTNAIIAGVIVLEAMKLLTEDARGYWWAAPSTPPRPKCTVCAPRPELTVKLDTRHTTIRTLDQKILRGSINMAAPDVEIMDGKGTIVISSEEGETECNMGKTLQELGIVDGTRLNCDDFLQSYTLVVNIVHCEKLDEGTEFTILGNSEEIKKAQEEEAEVAAEVEQNRKQKISNDGTKTADGGETSDEMVVAEVEDDDLVCLEDVEDEVEEQEVEEEEEEESRKRRSDDIVGGETQPLKKLKSGGGSSSSSGSGSGDSSDVIEEVMLD
ncbi:hypothetical protein Pcinc_041577 [Petrolisthes cinctipes]|uniref:SUMO-activating enzyme subunit n=1 Tax=Petrolisthes cinctipes TaxID=88211 RepID=A0AAE1BLR8_PETCI|nr:hypothetical protein Pcinc_041577 [Petrolisthes cinctipes]KAK3851798.1 hypothetical protein Pcinc_041577 [Petrolisthes cinctipes]KAK3851799.1 hypothetical protein Pcinc_041577 [Petrolisthes cinctipes]